MPCILIAVTAMLIPISDTLHNVVVVRFSLKVAEWRRRAFVNESNREAWFAYRARLFEQTLFASLCAQTKPVSAVYLLMNEDDWPLFETYLLQPLLQSQTQTQAQTQAQEGTPLPAKRAAPGKGRVPEIRPIFSSQAPHLQVAFDLLARGPTQQLTMSRIDSDDIVARNFFEELGNDIVSALQVGKSFDYVMAAQGYKSNLKQMQRCLYGRSPFLTRYWAQLPSPNEWASADNPPTVYDVSHVRIRDYCLLESLNATWLQLLHGTNVANGFSKGQPEPLPDDLSFLNSPNASPILCEEKRAFEMDWFRAWAGFEPPEPALFDQAPFPSAWDRVRVAWRRWKGRQ
jgi:hypothetical protein